MLPPPPPLNIFLSLLLPMHLSLSCWSCCFFLAENHHREKRQVHDHKKNTCPLLLVADYRFFEHMGRGQESVTLNYLVCPYETLIRL